MVRVSGSEDVVRDVAAHAVDVVFPLYLCGHALDVAEELALCEDLAGIHIALDVVLSALPRPSRAPLDARAGSAVKVGALRARGGSVLAPEVVQDFVAILGVVGVLTAKADLCLRSGDFANDGSSDFRDGCGGQV